MIILFSTKIDVRSKTKIYIARFHLIFKINSLPLLMSHVNISLIAAKERNQSWYSTDIDCFSTYLDHIWDETNSARDWVGLNFYTSFRVRAYSFWNWQFCFCFLNSRIDKNYKELFFKLLIPFQIIWMLFWSEWREKRNIVFLF